jgi:hypothetical protein
VSASCDTREEIINAVLGWFQELLKKTQAKCEFSVLPEEIWVEMRTRPSFALPPGEVFSRWRITGRDITCLPLASSRACHVAVASGFYRVAWGEFAISEDGVSVMIGFKLSPKFGRGDIYSIVKDNAQNLSLQRKKPAWSL